jgi:hypothetical protein
MKGEFVFKLELDSNGEIILASSGKNYKLTLNYLIFPKYIEIPP